MPFKFNKNPYYWMLVSSVGAIMIAYLSEIILDLVPCALCLYQRLFYFLIFILTICAYSLPNKRRFFYYPIALLLIAEIAAAAYHVGIEHYWIEDDFVCNDNSLAYLSFQRIASSCGNVRFKFMNFTLAEWNFFYATGLLYIFIKLRKFK